MRLLFLLLAIATVTAAGDWSRFRGPNGSGVDAAASGLPAAFGPSENMLWKTPVPFGRSSPILFGDRIYLTASEGDQLLTLCYRRTDGKLLWRRQASKAHNREIFRANDPASPTPVADAAGVFVFFPDLGIIAYSPDGNERWRVPLGPFDNFYGMAASPILDGNLLYLLCDHSGGSFLLALDKTTGKQRWKADRPDTMMGWSVPVLYAPKGQPKQLIVTGTTRVDSYYPATGERRWWMPLSSEGSMGVAVEHGDSLIVYASGHDQPWAVSFPQLLAQYDTDKNGMVSKAEFQAYKAWAEHFGWMDADRNGSLDSNEWQVVLQFGTGEWGVVRIAPNGQTGQLPKSAAAWRLKRQVPYVPAPVLYQGVYYMVKDGGIVTALNPDTGAILKQGRAAQSLGAYYASPVAADSKVFLLSAEGKLTVLKAGPQWEVLHVNDLQDEAYATPAIAGSRIYVRTRATLYCFGVQ